MTTSRNFFLNGKSVDIREIKKSPHIMLSADDILEKGTTYAFDSDNDFQDWLKDRGLFKMFQQENENTNLENEMSPQAIELQKQEEQNIKQMERIAQADKELSQMTGLALGSEELLTKMREIARTKDRSLGELSEIFWTWTPYGIVWEHENHYGAWTPLRFDEYPRLRRWGWNDMISSSKYQERVTEYEHDHFKGDRLYTSPGSYQTYQPFWNDRISSIWRGWHF